MTDLSNVLAQFDAMMTSEFAPECMRCEAKMTTNEEMYHSFIFVAASPSTRTPSPPHVLCEDCGWLTAAFMGVKVAKRYCEEKGLTA